MFDLQFDTHIQDGHHLVEWKTNFCMRAFIIMWLNTLFWFKWILLVVFLFHNLILYAQVCSNMKILCSDDPFWFQSYWDRDIHRNFRLLVGNSMVITQILCTNLTLLCHVCWRVCITTATYEWFPVNFRELWLVPHVEQEMLTISGTYDSDCTPFEECTLSLYELQNLSIVGLCLQINDCLFAWISLTFCLRLILPMKFGKVELAYLF